MANKELKIFPLKQVEFDLHKVGSPQVVLKYSVVGQRHQISAFEIFVDSKYLSDSDVMIFANNYFELIRKKIDVSNESDIPSFFKAFNYNKEYTMKKKKTILYPQVQDLKIKPYPSFVRFDSTIKENYFRDLRTINKLGVET